MVNDTMRGREQPHNLGGCRMQWRTIQTSHFRHEHSVEEFWEAAEFWGSARDADEIPKGYAFDAVEGGFNIYERNV